MESDDAVVALAALAHPTRLAVFRLLVECTPEGAVAGDIASRLGVAAPTLSFHLKELGHAGLVAAVAEGRYLRYRAEIPRLQGLIGFLTDSCCGGRPERCAPAPGARGLQHLDEDSRR